MRSFPLASIVHEGHARSGYRIRCSSCSAEEKVIASGWTGSLPETVIAKKFTQKGWFVGKSDKLDQCPDCIQRKKVRLTVVAEAKPAAEKPREMSREDKRLIWGKIDGVYLDEKRGYEDGWSDLRVATDLGVPLAWVRTIRDTDFGPEGMSAEARTNLAALAEYREKLEKLCAEQVRISKEITDLKAASTRLDRVAAEMERTFLRRAGRSPPRSPITANTSRP